MTTLQSSGVVAHGLVINEEGQAFTHSEVEAQAAHHAKSGHGFVVQTGFIASSATADTTTAMLYVKNTSTTQNIYIGIARTCGEVALKWIMKTGATGLSTENVITGKNLLIGSPKTIDATIYKGAQNATVTGGTEYTTWINGAGHSDPDYKGAIILGANQTMTLECLPFASVSGEACLSIEVWQI